MFSYGSGLASSMFSIKVNRSVSKIVEKSNILNRINNRIKLTPQEFTDVYIHIFLRYLSIFSRLCL